MAVAFFPQGLAQRPHALVPVTGRTL
jgi:hypothetical protein